LKRRIKVQLTANTVNGWSGVLADLAAKQQAAREHTERLRTQKQALALEAAMGSPDARKRLAQINQELAKLALESTDLDAALTQAEQSRLQAEAEQAEQAERARNKQITVHLEQYLKEVREIDKDFAQLASHFLAAKSAQDAAEALMTREERTPLQQLRSKFGPTLAAAHVGLGNHIELGPASMHIPHRQPLAAFAAPFTDRWTKAPHHQEASSGD
jgi:DNA repair exonuclease SbcCD ATPase subunit